MQNLTPNDSIAANHPSAVSDVLDRVVAILPAPPLPGEKQADYFDLAVRIVRAAKPRDAIEEFLVRDLVDLTWEVFRLRRVKAGILRASMDVGVQQALVGLGLEYGKSRELGNSWAAGNASARNNVDGVLKKAGLTIDEAMAKTVEKKLDSFERLDRILASAEARRNNALREIDRRRDALARGVHRSIEEIEDAEFRDVEAGEVSSGAKN